MKKFFFFIVLMLFTTIAQAENTTWVKGGLSFFDGETFCNDNNASFGDDPKDRCGDNFEGNSFFIQVSPINVRGKFNSSKLGYRIEPWMGYSQTGDTDAVGGQEYGYFQNGVLVAFLQAKLTNLSIKNFQFGTNLFLDFEVMSDFTVYGGPVAGFEFSQLSSEVTEYDNELDPATGEFVETLYYGRHKTSKWVSNFIYGAEVGAEYNITKNVTFGAFAGILQHSPMFDYPSKSQWNQGTEVRAGTGFTVYW